MTDAIVTLKQVYGGQSIENVLCFNNVVDVPTELQALADEIRVSLGPLASNVMSNAWSCTGVKFSFLSSNAVLYSVDYSFTLGDIQGQIGTDRLAPTIAMLVSLGYVGPKPNRGRIYLSGMTEAAYNSGAFTAAARAEAEALVNNWATGLTTAFNTHYLRILRRVSPKFPNFVSNQVQTVVARQNEANQRRRRAGSN